MATNNKDFRIKNGLVVEGSTATVNGNAIITSASSVNDLADVTVSSPSTGQVLKWNGSAWVNDTDNTGAGGSGNSFTTIDVPNGTDPVADSSTDTLTFADGANITITGNSTTDTITVAVDSDIININSITFDTTPTSPGTDPGTIYWDDGDGVPKAILNANVTVGINQELILKVKNATGSTIAKGKVVYINGAQGQNPTIALADADTEATSSKTFGFTAESIADGAEGFVVIQGVLRGVDTDGFTEGGAIYLSQTAGGYTQTIPAEPAHAVFLGYAVKAHASAGEVIIKIQNGYELNELHGVLIDNGSVVDNEVLSYETDSGLWINKTAAEAGLSVVGHTHSLSDVTDVTASAAEVNILDGATLSTTELNYVDGVTSAIQTQLDNKANTSDVAELARDAIGSALVAGANVTITPNDGADTITIASTDTNTTYSISAETATGGVNLRLTDSAATTDDVKIASGTNVTVTRTDANTITISSTDTDTNTTYAVSAETVAGGANLRLTGSDTTTDDVKIASGTNVTVSRTDANTITIDATDTNTVTRLQGTGGSYVSGDVIIQGTGATSTSQSGNTITVAVADGSTSLKGAVQLSDTVGSTSDTVAATPGLVYDSTRLTLRQTITSTGTQNVDLTNAPPVIFAIVVGGGGGGGNGANVTYQTGGGGGAGAIVSGWVKAESSCIVGTGGSGATGATAATSGGDSSYSTLYARGGIRGSSAATASASIFGAGGGGAGSTTTAAGSASSASSLGYAAGGGGGAAAFSSTASATGSDGGNGTSGGGGGGSTTTTSTTAAPTGGSGGSGTIGAGGGSAACSTASSTISATGGAGGSSIAAPASAGAISASTTTTGKQAGGSGGAGYLNTPTAAAQGTAGTGTTARNGGAGGTGGGGGGAATSGGTGGAGGSGCVLIYW